MGTQRGPVKHVTTVEGIRLAHLEQAAAPGCERHPCLVLVHGLGMSARTFTPLLAALPDGPRALAVDLPASGRSQSLPGQADPEALADLLWTWLDQLGVGRAVLIGHSLGSQVVTRLAARRPDRVVAVVLLAPAPDPESGGPVQTALRLFKGAIFEPAQFIHYAVVDFLRARPLRMWRVLVRAMGVADHAAIRSVPHPTLILRGERDSVSTADGVRILAGEFQNAHVEELPKAAHALHFDAADRIADLVRRIARDGADADERASGS